MILAIVETQKYRAGYDGCTGRYQRFRIALFRFLKVEHASGLGFPPIDRVAVGDVEVRQVRAGEGDTDKRFRWLRRVNHSTHSSGRVKHLQTDR